MLNPPPLSPGDKIAVLSPSFAAPGMFPEVYELGLSRLRDIFHLEPVEFPTTRKLGASKDERARDLIAAFEDPSIRGVIASIGGDDQVTYVQNLPTKPFVNNPKRFYGFSDNTNFANFLWLNGISSFYGGSIMIQLAMQTRMDDFTVNYLKKAFFESGEVTLGFSETFTDQDLDWSDLSNLSKIREHESNTGWTWSGTQDANGILWGGCLESIDDLLRIDVPIPNLDQFDDIILMTETAEDVPSNEFYTKYVYRALGERGILKRIKGLLVGRPKSRALHFQPSSMERQKYRDNQQKIILDMVRKYNPHIPIVQNLNFGHTDPQIPMPYGGKCRINCEAKEIIVTF